MFNKKKKHIAELTARNAELTEQVEALEHDPYVAIARALGATVARIVSSGRNVDPRVDAAIAQHEQALFEAEVARTVEAEIAARTKEEKARIAQQQQVEARQRAAAALQHFLANDADDYREAMRAKYGAETLAETLRAAKQQIATEEHQRYVEAAKQELLKQQVAENWREEAKGRAADLRNRTKISHMLSLAELEDGDPLLITFTEKGWGFEALTEQVGGSSTYRSELERRKIAGWLISAENGTFETEKDSWLRSSEFASQALRGGQQIQLRAENPLSDSAIEPCIVKGTPLIMQTLGGIALPSGELDVWWVNLADFRVLS